VKGLEVRVWGLGFTLIRAHTPEKREGALRMKILLVLSGNLD
jgi:hypothetical protein